MAICVCCWFACVLCWFAASYFMFRTVRLRKADVDPWRDTLLNPFNLLFMPSKLTEAGRASRRRCFLSVLGFFIFWVLGALVGTLGGIGES